MLLTKPAPENCSESHFSTEHVSADLKRLSVRGGAVTCSSQAVKFLLQLGSTACLARLLTPKDFGLIAMVTAVTGFIMIFKDLGLSQATIQCSSINHKQVSTLFWINIAVSIVLALITTAVAPAIAWFYKEPRLFWLTAALAGVFILSGLTIQHQALLSRQMRFVALVAIDIIALAVGIITGIVCAWAGLGYWSLVLMQITTAIATVVGVWLASGWRPGWPARHSGIRPMLAFGGYLTSCSFVNYFARTFDKILLGRYWGSLTLGFYTRAYSLLLLPMGQITAPISAVVVPTLSRLQDEPHRFRNYYLQAIKFIAYLSMPLIVALGALSTEIIALVLGRQWFDAGPIFMILAIAALLQPVVGTVGWIYVSLGQTRRMSVWTLMATPLIVLSFLLGLPWGAIGVAIGYSICNWILLYPEFVFALKYSPITVRNVFSVIFRPLAVSIIMGLAMTIARAYLSEFGLVWTTLGSSVVGTVFFLISVLVWPTVRKDIQDIFSIGKLILTKKVVPINADNISQKYAQQ